MNKKRKSSQPSGNNKLKKHRADIAQRATPRSRANPHDNPGVQQLQASVQRLENRVQKLELEQGLPKLELEQGGDVDDPEHLSQMLFLVSGWCTVKVAVVMSFLLQSGQFLFAVILARHDVTKEVEDIKKLVDDGLLSWCDQSSIDCNHPKGDQINFLAAIRTGTIVLTDKWWQTSVPNMLVGTALFLLFLAAELNSAFRSRKYHALDATNPQMRSGMLVISFQIIVAIVVASTSLVHLFCKCSLLDIADTVQVSIETFCILEIGEKAATILWSIISNCGDVKLEGREDPVTLVEALLHKSESEQDKSTIAILWAINCGDEKPVTLVESEQDKSKLEQENKKLLKLNILRAIFRAIDFLLTTFAWIALRWGVPFLASPHSTQFWTKISHCGMALIAGFAGARAVAYFLCLFRLRLLGHRGLPLFEGMGNPVLFVSTIFFFLFAFALSPFTDPRKGFTGLVEGSIEVCHFFYMTEDDFRSMFDGRNPVFTISAIMWFIKSLVYPSYGSRWFRSLFWLEMAVALSPFSGPKELIALTTDLVLSQATNTLIVLVVIVSVILFYLDQRFSFVSSIRIPPRWVGVLVCLEVAVALSPFSGFKELMVYTTGWEWFRLLWMIILCWVFTSVALYMSHMN